MSNYNVIDESHQAKKWVTCWSGTVVLLSPVVVTLRGNTCILQTNVDTDRIHTDST
jgi:hypothetical protein